jgi:hypothetical protein
MNAARFSGVSGLPRNRWVLKAELLSVAKSSRDWGVVGAGREASHGRASDNGVDGIEVDLVCGVFDGHCLCDAGGCGFGRVVPGQAGSEADACCRGDYG